jgi:hypothetical protein
MPPSQTAWQPSNAGPQATDSSITPEITKRIEGASMPEASREIDDGAGRRAVLIRQMCSTLPL